MAEAAFLEGLNRLGPALLGALQAFDFVRRQLHPPRIGALQEALDPFRVGLAEALRRFDGVAPPEGLEALSQRLAETAVRTEAALRAFCEPAPAHETIPRVLSAMHQHCQAQALLYPVRKVLPPVSLFFLEPAFHDRVRELDPDPPAGEVGVFHVRDPSMRRGGFWLYVPESYDGARPWPLVVALHGGSGTGEDFLWSWLKEARGRRFLLMAPTSLGSTWSLMGDDVDGPSLRRMVEHVRSGWNVDAGRVLLTGLSDGATYALIAGLRENVPYTALAPVSGVLHPGADLGHAGGKRVYLVHGALDWMFPVALARMAHEELRGAGADVTYREIEDLSHTYPRDENDRILTWFDPSLGLPGTA